MLYIPGNLRRASVASQTGRGIYEVINGVRVSSVDFTLRMNVWCFRSMYPKRTFSARRFHCCSP